MAALAARAYFREGGLETRHSLVLRVLEPLEA
jgi:hypothetical protein